MFSRHPGKVGYSDKAMEWSHIDLDAAIWVTPADKMKKRKEHRQPLTEPVLTMLKQMKEMKGNQRYVLANNDKP